MEIPTEVAKNETQSLVNLVKKEAGYLCCFNSYAQEFEGRKERLNAELDDVRRRIDKARGASHVTFAARQWKGEAEKLIAGDAQKEKCFNDLCLNCWRQYRKGKDLAKRTLEIDKLLVRCKVNIVDGAADLPGIKYHCIPTFMDFKSRKSTFQDLKEALEDEENNMIGLYGLGGTGKTSMATEVGARLEGTTFDKVIVIVVSKPLEFKRLRDEIARQLGMKSQDGEQEVHRDQILNKINALEGKLLIVLDDVWKEFDLTKELGIPHPHLNKGCRVLITTRMENICTKMGCQKNIHLDALSHEEALSLFLQHTNNSSNLESLAKSIVKYCHGVPVVIVAVARSLKDRPFKVWKESLRTLKRGGSILKVREDLKKVYECLKLSYDNLTSEKAKMLFLIFSLFPEDLQVPEEALTRIGIGMGPFGEVDDYNERRKEVSEAIWELQDSSLLVNAERDCVKMHDLVREVALLIGENDIQSVIEPEQPMKKSLQFLFWKNNDFPKQLDGGNLEILIMQLYPSCVSDLNVPDTSFREMTKLKVLVLENKQYIQISAPSLFLSIQSLPDLQTLMLEGFELCCSSMLGKLLNLETLWLDRCSITKLREESFELRKLRFLRIENCEFKVSNPFELTKACPKLEELTFLRNEYDKMENKHTISQKVSWLDNYQISSVGLSHYFKKYDSGLSRCFQPGDLIHLISEATFKQLARTSDLLILEGHEKTEHKNLIPDIVPVDDRGETNLIILNLSSCPSMQCLIDGMNNHVDVNAFSNLSELSLHRMGLSDILFNGNYNLCHLKVMRLEDCPKLTSIFLSFTAQKLSRLEKLKIKGCDALKCILGDKSSRGEITGDEGDNDQKNYGALFPKFKVLEIESCGNLEIILPILLSGGHLRRIIIRTCEKLSYIFDKFQEVNDDMPSLEIMELSELPSFAGVFRKYQHLQQPTSAASRENLKEMLPSTKTHSFCWAQVCCFKSRATSEEEANGAVSPGRLPDEGIPQGLLASKKRIDTSPTLVSQLGLHVCRIKKMELANIPLNSVSRLFTLSMAATISWEELTITECDGLTHLVKIEEDYYKDQCCFIFPKLQNLEIQGCKDLGFLFLSSISIEIKNLKSLTIRDAPKLTYVVGKYQHDHHCISNQKQNDELRCDLPALEALCFRDVPEFISIGPMNFQMISPSLQNVYLDEGQINSNTTKEVDASTNGVPPSLAAQSLLIQSVKNVRKIRLWNCGNIILLSTLSIAMSKIALETLTIYKCHKLKCITIDQGDAQVNKNNCSIFPTLEELEIKDCEELETLFVSSISVGLENLKSLAIEEVPKLKYVVGNYQKEPYPSNQNQNDELCFNLPALETLNIENAPMINGICSKKYKLELSSPLNVWIENCRIKSFIEEVHAPTIGAPLFHVTQSLSKNIREIKLVECTDLISLTTLSIASTILWEVLTLRACGQLKCIVADGGDDRIQINCNSIFPKLKCLEVSDCDALEYLFPAYAFISPLYLESLEINNAPMLKYVFGRSQHDDSLNPNNQNIQTLINFPVLKHLSIGYLPKLVSIYPENYYMRGLYLRSVMLEELPKFTMRHFNEFLVCWHIEQQETKVIEMCWKTVEYLQVHDFKIEEIFDLTYMKTEKKGGELQPLSSSLRHLNLLNLSELVIYVWGLNVPYALIVFGF